MGFNGLSGDSTAKLGGAPVMTPSAYAPTVVFTVYSVGRFGLINVEGYSYLHLPSGAGEYTICEGCILKRHAVPPCGWDTEWFIIKLVLVFLYHPFPYSVPCHYHNYHTNNHLPFYDTTGSIDTTVKCWRPLGGINSEMRSFFLGASPHLADKESMYATGQGGKKSRISSLNMFGVSSENSGEVRISDHGHDNKAIL